MAFLVLAGFLIAFLYLNSRFDKPNSTVLTAKNGETTLVPVYMTGFI